MHNNYIKFAEFWKLENLTSIKSKTLYQMCGKWQVIIPNYIVYINAHLKLGRILSIRSEDNDQKRKFDISQGSLLCYICAKMMPYNHNIDHVNINVYTKFYQFFLKIMSRNKNLISIKGHYSVANLRKMTGNNPSLGLVNMNAYTKFGHIPSGWALVLCLWCGPPGFGCWISFALVSVVCAVESLSLFHLLCVLTCIYWEMMHR